MNQKYSAVYKTFFGFFLLLIVACNGPAEKKTAEIKTTYTCPMHPQIVQDKPGTCPICGMDLVVFDRTNKEQSLTLNASQVALANISTIIAGDTGFSNQKQLNGRLAINPEKTVYVSSRVAGRIDVLNVRETGVKVAKGQPIFGIYSEELAALQQEYLVAAAQLDQFPGDERFRDIEKAAKQKLLLYGQTKNQLAQLLQTKKTNAFVEYTAPVNGVVAELSVTQGQYVSEGGPIMRIENYDELWVEADLYPSEASDLKIGETVDVNVNGTAVGAVKMKIEFINPNLTNGRQLLQVRGTISNKNNLLQPGMQAVIRLRTAKQSGMLTIPAGAVIRDEKGAHVWVETAESKFEPRMVKTGTENAETVEVTEGVGKGDRVVVTGAYLLNSEYILKKGNDPMASHNH